MMLPAHRPHKRPITYQCQIFCGYIDGHRPHNRISDTIGLVTSGSSLAKIVEQRTIKKRSNIFIVDKFYKKSTSKIGDFKIMKHVYM